MTPRTSLRAAALAAALAAACGSTTGTVVAGDFNSPEGIAVAPARDRDLVFIANTGGDELRAISICNKPSNADGSSAETTCLSNEDFHFIPGPIRVFPGSLPGGRRPTRLAGVALRDAGGLPQGALLVAGVATEAADGSEVPSLKLVDAANVVDAMKGAAPLKQPRSLPLESPPVDVVALQLIPGTDSPAAATAPAFVLTQEATGVTGQVIALTVTPSASGPTVAIAGRCALDFLGTRLALVPGRADKLYVADGTPGGTPGARGDGAVEILTAAIPAGTAGVPAACPINRRISAADAATGKAQPLRSLALSPAFRTGDGRNFAAGDLLGAITEDGRVLLLSSAFGGPAPMPPFETPFKADDGSAGGAGPTAPRMEPLRTNGVAREFAFLNNPLSCPADTAVGAPCVLIRVGTTVSDSRTPKFALVGAVSSSDGAVYFLDADRRRFVSETRDGKAGEPAPTPSVSSALTFSPAQPDGQESPTLTFAPAQTDGNGVAIPGGYGDGWLTAGVTRRASWRAIWHGVIPGLERRGGTLTLAADGKLRLDVPGGDFTSWIAAGQLGAGDVVSFAAFTAPSSTLCDALVTENKTPLTRELRIAAVEARALVIDVAAAGLALPAACFPAGGVVEVRTADGLGGRPWLILEGIKFRGRTKNGEQFIARDTRFDYPLNYDPAQPLPTPDRNVSVSFTITGTDPVTVGSLFGFSLDSGHQPTLVRDATTSFGFAGPLAIYTSRKITGNLVFVSQSGANAVLQIDPSLIGVLNGVLAYR